MSLGATLPVRALVADDDPLLLDLLAAFLEARDYVVERAADGQQALERVLAGGINLLVTDRNMPRMDGLALCRAVRDRMAGPYVYCIMLTASDDEQSLVEAMEAGVDDFVAKPLRHAELGARLRAAERVLALQAGLAAQNEALAEAYAQLRRDLEVARAMQLGQLPGPQAWGPLAFDGLFEPSSYVGGDLYDWFPLGDRLLAFYVADVAGHGVAAAMLAVSAQHELRTVAQQVVRQLGEDDLGAAAAEVVARYNDRFLQRNESGMYLTLVFGLADRGSRRVALVHAGHPPALLLTRGQPPRPLGEGSLPVGILAGERYEATHVDLPAGSRLALYSDGVTDCADAQGRMVGQERLAAWLQEGCGLPLDQACGQLRGSLRGWRDAGYEDDVTLLLLDSR